MGFRVNVASRVFERHPIHPIHDLSVVAAGMGVCVYVKSRAAGKRLAIKQKINE